MIPGHSHDAALRVVRSLNLDTRDPALGLLGKATVGGELEARTPRKKQKSGGKVGVKIRPGVDKEAATNPPGVDEEATTPPVVEEEAATTPPVVEEEVATTPPVVEEQVATTPPVVEEQVATTPPVVEEVATTPPATATPAAECAAPTKNAEVKLVNTDPKTANTNDANLQTFTGALGGFPAPGVTVGGRGFNVQNNDSFLNKAAALGRSCDVQKNQCADAANASGNVDFSVGDCDAQANACRAAIQ